MSEETPREQNLARIRYLRSAILDHRENAARFAERAAEEDHRAEKCRIEVEKLERELDTEQLTVPWEDE